MQWQHDTLTWCHTSFDVSHWFESIRISNLKVIDSTLMSNDILQRSSVSNRRTLHHSFRFYPWKRIFCIVSHFITKRYGRMLTFVLKVVPESDVSIGNRSVKFSNRFRLNSVEQTQVLKHYSFKSIEEVSFMVTIPVDSGHTSRITHYRPFCFDFALRSNELYFQSKLYSSTISSMLHTIAH